MQAKKAWMGCLMHFRITQAALTRVSPLIHNITLLKFIVEFFCDQLVVFDCSFCPPRFGVGGKSGKVRDDLMTLQTKSPSDIKFDDWTGPIVNLDRKTTVSFAEHIIYTNNATPPLRVMGLPSVNPAIPPLGMVCQWDTYSLRSQFNDWFIYLITRRYFILFFCRTMDVIGDSLVIAFARIPNLNCGKIWEVSWGLVSCDNI